MPNWLKATFIVSAILLAVGLTVFLAYPKHDDGKTISTCTSCW